MINDFFKDVIRRALEKNHNLNQIWIDEFINERLKTELDLVRLDNNNIALIADEMGCSINALKAFISINKAIANHAKVD